MAVEQLTEEIRTFCRDISGNNPSHGGYIHQQQIMAAGEVLSSFLAFRDSRGSRGASWAILTALMQSGKTGVAQAFWALANYNEGNKVLRDLVAPGNVYIITGANSTDWVDQTASRMAFMGMGARRGPRILHNSHMQALMNHWQNGRKLDLLQQMRDRTIFIVDEAHFAQMSGSTLHRFLRFLQISPDGGPSASTRCYIVTLSATPMSESVANERMKYKCRVILHPGPNYLGPRQLIDAARVRQSWPLTTPDAVHRLLADVEQMRTSFPSGMHIIVRAVEQGQVVLRRTLAEDARYAGMTVCQYDAQARGVDTDLTIRGLIESPPDNGEVNFILVKRDLGMAMTFPLDNVAIMFDTASSKSDTAAQSFFGRALGYRPAQERLTRVYCDMAAVERYARWADSEFDVARTPLDATNMVRRTATTFSRTPVILLEMGADDVQRLAGAPPSGLQNRKELARQWIDQTCGPEFAPAHGLHAHLMETVLVLRENCCQNTYEHHFAVPLRAVEHGDGNCLGPGRKVGAWQMAVSDQNATRGRVVITRTGRRTAPLPATKGQNAGQKRDFEMFTVQ